MTGDPGRHQRASRTGEQARQFCGVEVDAVGAPVPDGGPATRMRPLEEPEWIRDHAARSRSRNAAAVRHRGSVFGRCAPGRGKRTCSEAPRGCGLPDAAPLRSAPQGAIAPSDEAPEADPVVTGGGGSLSSARSSPASAVRRITGQNATDPGTRPHPARGRGPGSPVPPRSRGGRGPACRVDEGGPRGLAGEGSRGGTAGGSTATRPPSLRGPTQRPRGHPAGKASAAMRAPQGTHPGRPGHRQRPAGWSAPVDRSTGRPRRAERGGPLPVPLRPDSRSERLLPLDLPFRASNPTWLPLSRGNARTMTGATSSMSPEPQSTHEATTPAFHDASPS